MKKHVRTVVRCLAVVVATTVLGATLFGCAGLRREGTARGLDRGLNAFTDLVDPAFKNAAEVCDWAEGAVIRRHPPEEAEAAEAELREVRTRCDGIYSNFENARRLQGNARDMADALRAGSVTEGDAFGAVRAARDAFGAVKASVDAFRDWRTQHNLIPDNPDAS